MFKWFGEFIDRIFVVVFAALFSQIPLYIQQYTQRLSGHVTELKLQLDSIRSIATRSGKSLDEYIQKFLTSSDFDFAKQGDLMQAMQVRLSKLSDYLSALHHSSTVSKPFVFLSGLDWQVAKATLYQYSPGLLLNAEGFCFAIVGIAVGYLLFRLLAGLFRIFSYSAKRST